MDYLLKVVKTFGKSFISFAWILPADKISDLKRKLK